MSNGLAVVGIVVVRGIVRVRIRAHPISFQLQIQVLNPGNIDVFHPYLPPKFISPPAGSVLRLFQHKFVNDDLAVKRKPPNGIPFKVRPHNDIIGAPALLFYSPVKNNRVEVTQLKRTLAHGVFRTEYDGFKQPEVKLSCQC